MRSGSRMRLLGARMIRLTVLRVARRPAAASARGVRRPSLRLLVGLSVVVGCRCVVVAAAAATVCAIHVSLLVSDDFYLTSSSWASSGSLASALATRWRFGDAAATSSNESRGDVWEVAVREDASSQPLVIATVRPLARHSLMPPPSSVMFV